MKKINLILIIITLFILSLSYAQEWGTLEISTEVNSKYGQDYFLSFEKWWDENLGIGTSLLYNSLLKEISYKTFLQTPYLKLIVGKFYPNLNIFTEDLELKGFQTSFHLGNNEIFYVSGDTKDLSSFKILGWSSLLSKNTSISLSLSAIKENAEENYLADILILNKNKLPLGNIDILQESNIYLRNSNLYVSFITKTELSIGSISLKGLLGYLNPNTPSFCALDSGDFGAILSLAIPFSSNIFPEYTLGYLYNTKIYDHKIIVGLNNQWNLSNYLYLISTIKYVYSFRNNSKLYTHLSFNFPTLEGRMWNSIYIKYEKNLNKEDISLGLKISYQF